MNGSIPPPLNKGNTRVLSVIYIYIAVCMFCAVRCLIITRLFLLFCIYSTYAF